ncbi:GMC family oxidoreductase [Conexibacter sp. JD483]|uniref:FAD-dependent oxidoreductase n=1 Tax=unclassified Conexibacter TaxID=2627773 RepID=UPI002729297B|nr:MULTISPECIES: GMC family oxidoreductase [unclassified Conexibacter]MDO8189231.1 GMC family oxidoreductase [Conexibacter sp. CPCC 205706]MDO8201148.1 GMC family oxidoreductase [Conexibacter sp. CPCC 205762]MDR9372069.1 GMC family oxidoreductase [Conexibacter sp. JD483]
MLLLAALIYFLGPMAGPAQSFYGRAPFVANSVPKVTLLALAALYAAGSPRRRGHVVVLFVAAHLVSVGAMVLALLFGATGGTADLGFATPSIATVLWGAIVLDGVITGLTALMYVRAHRAAARVGGLSGRAWTLKAELADPLAPGGSAPAASAGEASAGEASVGEASAGEPAAGEAISGEAELTAAERRLRGVAIGLTALFGVLGLAYVAGFVLHGTRDAFTQLPFVTNSTVLCAGIALLCGTVAGDVRRNLPLAGPALSALLLSALVDGAYLAFRLDAGDRFPLWGWEPTVSGVLWILLAIQLAAGLGLWAATSAAWRARERIAFLGPLQQRALLALADVLIAAEADEPEAVPPRQIAANVERYVGSIRARRVWVYRLALAVLELRPLLAGWPPLSQIEPQARRDFLQRRFLRPPPWPRFAKNLTQVTIRVGQQLSFAGYYNDPGAWPSIGYTPFSQRGRPVPKAAPLRLSVDTPESVEGETIEADVCVIGSGAGGAILAYELARAGRDVLLLEKGPYVQPHQFSEDEVEMIGQLYGDGIMQQTTDFRFTVLQGSCVGGSTTVNNAVCFRTPEPVLRRWNDGGAALDLTRLAASWDEVEAFLDVHTQTEAVLNRSGSLYLRGAAAIGGAAVLEREVVRANVRDCVGSGYCNIGCAYGRKLSMLDRTLPRAQADFPGRVRIVAECEVERLRTSGGRPARVADVRARLGGSGGKGGRMVTIRAQDVVVSAGAIASSYLLLRSGIGGLFGPGPRLPVGRGLCFNMGAPLTAEFAEPVRAYDGLQISHYGIPQQQHGFVFETWFNPPVAQALNMPGWFERHFDNMRRYDHLMAVGVIAGTAGNARVRRALTGGSDISYRPRPEDLRTLGRGLTLLGELLFAAGAERVMLNTWGWDEMRSAAELPRIAELVMDPDYVTLGTGHPQGGNAISADPRRGVVDPQLRVHGFDNLHVCDASVFPSSISVNPQLTVMGLAHYAAPLIAAGRR